MNQINKNVKVLVSQIIPIAIGLLSVHFILKNYGESLFGVFNILLATLSFCSVLDLGMGRILSQSTAEKYNLSNQKNSVVLDHDINSSITFAFVISVAVTLLGLLFITLGHQNPWNLNTDDWERLKPPLFWTLMSVPFIVLSAIRKGALEGLHEFTVANRIQTISSSLIFLTPLAFSFFSQDLTWPFICLFCLRILLFLYCKSNLGKTFKLQFSLQMKTSRTVLISSLWISLSAILSSALLYSDRFILVGKFTLENLAPYTTAIDLVLRALIVPQALSRLMLPVFTQNRHSQIEMPKTTNFYFSRMAALVVFPLLLLNYFGGPIIQLWLSPEFGAKVFRFIPWLSLGIAINSISWVAFNHLQARKEFKILFYIQLFSGLVYFTAFKIIQPSSADQMIQLWASRFVLDAFVFYGYLKWKYPEIPQLYAWLINVLIVLAWWPSLY